MSLKPQFVLYTKPKPAKPQYTVLQSVNPTNSNFRNETNLV